jgi:hypothetical protein
MRHRQGGRQIRQLHYLALSALLGLAFVGSACEEAKSPDSVESDESPSQNPMEELQAIPTELSAQVADLTKPIDDVQKVIDQLTSIPKRYGFDAADMIAMAKATLESGKVDVTVSGDVSADAKAEIETALTTLKGAVAALKATPDRVASLLSRIATSSAKVPELAAKVSVSATAAAANPFAGVDAKAKAQADVQEVKQVVADVLKVARDTQAKIVGIPAMATGALTKLTAALNGGDGTVSDSDEAASMDADHDTDASTQASARSGVTSGRKLAVVRVSIGANTTQVARVRRAVDYALAIHGLGAVPASMLTETTRAEGLRLPEGASTAQFDEKIRATLGAAVTVRVSQGVDDSIRVGVSTGAEKTKTIPANPDEMASTVSVAIGELLEGCGFDRKGTAAPAAADDGLDVEPPIAPAETRGSASTATANDQVILKDGTTIRGRMVEQAPGTFVTIEAADGTQRTIPWDRVREVVVAPPAKTK